MLGNFRGITPSYENPQWRFLQGRGELLANNFDGAIPDPGAPTNEEIAIAGNSGIIIESVNELKGVFNPCKP